MEDIDLCFSEGECCHVLTTVGVNHLLVNFSSTLNRVALSIDPTKPKHAIFGLNEFNVAPRAKCPHIRIDISDE